MYFHLGDLDLITFKNEIISLFNKEDPLYNFHTGYIYII
jgi:hypothetical protein